MIAASIAAGAGTVLPGFALAKAAVRASTAVTSSSSAAAAAGICLVTPEVVEGPYYFDPKLVRADITEGKPGIPVKYRLQIVDAMCRPLVGARVDIWHCDASGLYSNYAGQGDDRKSPANTKGETFLRGTQATDKDGFVSFVSIYPGWYRGRTTHTHFKVFLRSSNVLTGQIFFPDALSEYLYDNVAPYSARTGRRDTLNDGDLIAKQATRASFASIKEEDKDYLVSLVIGVDPNAKSNADKGPPGGQRGGPPGGSGNFDGPMPNGKRSGSLVPGEKS